MEKCSTQTVSEGFLRRYFTLRSQLIYGSLQVLQLLCLLQSLVLHLPIVDPLVGVPVVDSGVTQLFSFLVQVDHLSRLPIKDLNDGVYERITAEATCAIFKPLDILPVQLKERFVFL